MRYWATRESEENGLDYRLWEGEEPPQFMANEGPHYEEAWECQEGKSWINKMGMKSKFLASIRSHDWEYIADFELEPGENGIAEVDRFRIVKTSG